MGTIPTIPTFTNPITSAYFAAIKAANDFWGATPRCYAYQTATQTLATSGTEVAINLDTELFDIVQTGDTPSHDNVTNNTRIFARTAGKYRITGQITFAANATGYRQARIKVNAAGNPANGTEIGLSVQGAISGIPASVPLIVPIYALNAGDYVELFGVQTSTGSLALNASGSGRTFLALELTSA